MVPAAARRQGPHRLRGLRRSPGVGFLARSAHDETGSANGDAAVSHELSVAGRALDESTAGTARALTSAEAGTIERAAAPAAAAVANALFNATGVRFRAPPFDAERIRRALADAPSATLAEAPAQMRRPSRWRRWLAGGGIGGVMGGLIGLACSVLPGPAPIAPIASVDTSLWSPATLERE